LKRVLEAALQGEMDAHLGRVRGEQTAEGETVSVPRTLSPALDCEEPDRLHVWPRAPRR
jgi:transposase-like protein